MTETLTSKRGGFLDFSPVRNDNDNKENDVPVLSLIQFSKAPFVTFGSVKLGTSKSAFLRIDNPTEDAEAEVTVERISSSKGFSVDHNTFTIQPESSFTLTVTWTPTEEGGIRELLIFNANGILKHQAVLLGRAEAPKKKKKTLWDTIKNKRQGEKVAAPRGKKMEPSLKLPANKTYQVSRKPQYKRSKPCSPLASLNDGKTVRERRSLSKRSTGDNHPQELDERKVLNGAQRRSVALLDQENIHHVQRSSPHLLHIPVMRMSDSSNVSAGLGGFLGKPENKDFTKMLNRTLSPIGTPERFKKLMPHIQSVESPAPVGADTDDVDSALNRTPVLSLKEALALIDSDLIPINTTPPDTNSSCDFSDSLESKSGQREHQIKAGLDSPGSNEPRLTFFVSKKVVASEVVVFEAEPEKAVARVKKASFTSATVTKGKAPVEASSSSGRKIKKSRRRLLEKTLELSDCSRQSESGPGTPSLPVIDVDAGVEDQQSSVCAGQEGLEFTSSSPRLGGAPAPMTCLLTSPLTVAPSRLSFSPRSLPTPPAPITSTPPSLTPTSQLRPSLTSASDACEPAAVASAPFSAPPFSQEESFPIYSAANVKKRKSEEFLRTDGKTENAGKTEQVKRSRMAPVKREPNRVTQERRNASQRPQPRAAGSVRSTCSSSLKSTRSAVPPQAKQHDSKLPSRGAHSLKSSGVSSVRKAKVVAVAQSKLTFIKPAQTAIPRHPMPFAAKNMFYDERWIEKQERGFTWWINYVLTPDDFKVNTEVTKVSAVSLAMGSDRFNIPNAPTKEEMSYSTYTARRKLNRLRRSACQLFTSEAMVKAIQRLEIEVEAKRLLVRKDRHLWKDIGERQKVLNWLLSYNPLWLRIGLETIYGELISLESNSDALGLAMFILQRLLWNPDIAAEFRHAKVPHLYKDGHEEALSRFTLKKLLLLVCFLDRAKESRLIEHDPCLFCMDAEFKTSKDLLLAFSRDFLSGEGILPRHLGYLGLPVSHVQTALDEFNFAVKNLAVDLKCGIRLVRVMELLIQDWSLSAKLRLPAISRLQKVHNVDIALQVLKNKGVDLKDEHGSAIDSRDIVDGHREKTLSLLWKIIFAFHVEVILDEDQLREEIGFLRKTLKTKRRLASLRADRGFQASPAKAKAPYEHSSTKITLLMDWVRTVCDFYNLKVENFTVAFSDGRVLCHLIHHYHTSLLPAEAVSHSTTQTVECSPRGRLELNCSASDSDSSFDSSMTRPNAPDSPSVEFKELLENEKNNFRLVNTAVSFLGGVPAMINPADMSNTIPNEKVVMSYLSFLCARLLDLRNETRAARVIQAAWRKYRLQKDLRLFQERSAAAVKIQLLVRSFLQRRREKRQSRAAVVIQAFWRGYVARRKLRLQRETQLRRLQSKAAAVIQARWRMYSALKAFQRLRYYTIVVQAQWRMRRAAAAYGRMRWAATVVQRHSRAWALAKRQRHSYLSLRTAVMKIQRGYRRWKAQKMGRENGAARVIQAAFKKWYRRKRSERTAAVVRIQSWYRMQRCLHQYRNIKRSTMLIQAQYRGNAQRRRFQKLKLQHHSAIVIQSAFRGHAVRKQVAHIRWAAVVIQRRFRASAMRDAERQLFVKKRCAAITIQAAFRGKLARGSLKNQHKAATLIQAGFRKYVTQRHYLLARRAATVIQRKFRASTLARETRKDYEALRKAAIVIQANWRGRADRKEMERQNRCATLIQACYRRHTAQEDYRSKKAAAIVVQRCFRAYVTGKEIRRAYLDKKTACVALQAAFRGMKVRTEMKKKHRAAAVIQSRVRMFLCRKHYSLLQSAAAVIQSRYRALMICQKQQHEYRQLKRATIKIQAVYRGFRVRKDLQIRHDAATAIQAQFKMHKTRMIFLATKCAAIIIQERFKAKIIRDRQMLKYRAMKAAAVAIQAAYRGYRVRRKIAQMHRAATVIQRKFLTTQARNQFVALKAAALVCQQRYKSVIVARGDRRDFVSKRRAAICLQAAYRGHKVRRQLRAEHMAARTIQSHFRKHRQRCYYKSLCWAAKVIQARFRANKKMREETRALKAKKTAAVVLQAAFRGMRSRRIMRERCQAARLIQRAYRAHCEHKHYLTLKSSAIAIQQRYRAAVAANHQRKQYLQMRRAAVTLQAAYRGLRVRKEVACRHRAATMIQTTFRKHREEVKFKAMRLSAIIIQRGYRSIVLQRQEREKFLTLRHSTVVLQAAFRGRRVRKTVTKMHRAATVIQANFRRCKQQAAFRKHRWAAGVLQQRFRAQRRMILEVEHYQQQRKAVILLQAAYRSMKSRQNVKRMHHAASAIQRSYRAHCDRRRYLALKSSVITVQRRYRATAAAKVQMQQFQKMREATVILQAAYRGQRVRKEVRRRNLAATVIQSAFRKHREEVKFQAMRLSAIIIQRYYRSSVLQRRERNRFLKLRNSVLVLQAAFRGCCVRKNVTKMHKAATVIQANFKRHKQQTGFRRQRWAACVLQQRFRARRWKNMEVEHYQQQRRAVISLQAAYRGMKSRQNIQRMHQAATAIQRAYRAYSDRKQYLAIKSSVITIQRRYRATVAAKEQMQQYQNMKSAAVALQAAYRGRRIRREVACWHKAATVVQSAFRKHTVEVKYKALRLSAIIIQRHYRAFVLQRQERAEFLKTRRSAVILQAAFRGLLVRKQVANMQRAAIVIQANFKRHKQQTAFRRQRWAACVLQQRFRARRQKNMEVEHYQQQRRAVISLQAAYRGMKSRQNVKRMHQAAGAIQRAYRAHCEHKEYLNLKSSVLAIQRKYRATVAAEAQRKHYLEMQRSAIALQAAYRGLRVRKEIAQWHQAATVIQSAFRKHREEVKFQATRLSATIIQRFYRSWVLQRQERQKYLKVKHSAILLQAAFRGWYVRRDIARQSQAATVIQSRWRCLVQRRLFRRKWEAAVKLQRRIRAVWLSRVEREKFTQKRRAAIVLQTHCRAWIARRKALEAANAQRRLRFTAAIFHHLHAMKIQRALRAHWALQSAKKQIHSVITIQRWVRTWHQRRRYLEDKRKVVTAQRAAKRWLSRRQKAACVIQQTVRRFLLLRRQKRVQQGIVKAQALWRGYRYRKLNDNPTVVKLRHRLQKVTAGAREEDKLCNKTSSALEYLLRYKHFSYILEALKNLETATRLSPECCERLIESKATDVIFTLIRCCNRSGPCMDVITFSIQILLNLSKYHKTIEAVYSVEHSVATLLDLLQRYREKAGDKVAERGGSIFTKTCFLLALLLQDKQRAVEVKKLPKALDRIQSIYRLTARKHKMDSERTVVKQKMSASINGSFYIQATPRKTRSAPKFAPEWVLRKDKLKDIVDPLRAIQMVAETLSIVL